MAAKGYFDALVKLGELASDSQGSKELGECMRKVQGKKNNKRAAHRLQPAERIRGVGKNGLWDSGALCLSREEMKTQEEM